jgi:hypothetical protein
VHGKFLSCEGRWIAELSFIKHSFSALAINEYKGREIACSQVRPFQLHICPGRRIQFTCINMHPVPTLEHFAFKLTSKPLEYTHTHTHTKGHIHIHKSHQYNISPDGYAHSASSAFNNNNNNKCFLFWGRLLLTLKQILMSFL